MFFDFSEISTRAAYKLLAASVVPRPIALITTLGEQGVINAAPYSFFNVIGSDPALVVVGISGGEAEKDTLRNLRSRGEFVVNLVNRPLAEAMNICAIDFPPNQSEVSAAGLQTAQSRIVNVPRIVACPVSLECREHTMLLIGSNQLVVGEVLALWCDEQFVDAEKFHIDSAGLNLIGRMGGAGGYTETGETFEIARISYDQWLKEPVADFTLSDSHEK